MDQSHSVVPHVEVTATNALTGQQRNTQTNDLGIFSLPGLPIAGAYDVKAVKQGFGEAELANITLIGGQTADINLQLNVSATETKVTVTGIVGEIRTDEAQLGERLGARQMEETPLPDRKITYLPLLNAANRPAINQGDVFMNENLFTTNGAGRRQTWFEVDGSTGQRQLGAANHLQQHPAHGAARDGCPYECVFGRIWRKHGKRGEHHHKEWRQSFSWRTA